MGANSSRLELIISNTSHLLNILIFKQLCLLTNSLDELLLNPGDPLRTSEVSRHLASSVTRSVLTPDQPQPVHVSLVTTLAQ